MKKGTQVGWLTLTSTVGYVKGNIQWVHKDINMMKQQFKQKHFIEMCKRVAKCAS